MNIVKFIYVSAWGIVVIIPYTSKFCPWLNHVLVKVLGHDPSSKSVVAWGILVSDQMRERTFDDEL